MSWYILFLAFLGAIQCIILLYHFIRWCIVQVVNDVLCEKKLISRVQYLEDELRKMKGLWKKEE